MNSVTSSTEDTSGLNYLLGQLSYGKYLLGMNAEIQIILTLYLYHEKISFYFTCYFPLHFI